MYLYTGLLHLRLSARTWTEVSKTNYDLNCHSERPNFPRWEDLGQSSASGVAAQVIHLYCQ